MGKIYSSAIERRTARRTAHARRASEAKDQAALRAKNGGDKSPGSMKK